MGQQEAMGRVPSTGSSEIPGRTRPGQVSKQGGVTAKLGWGFRNSGYPLRVVIGARGSHWIEVRSLT